VEILDQLVPEEWATRTMETGAADAQLGTDRVDHSSRFISRSLPPIMIMCPILYP